MNFTSMLTSLFILATFSSASSAQEQLLSDEKVAQELSTVDNQQHDVAAETERTLNIVFTGDKLTEFKFYVNKNTITEGYINIAINNKSKRAWHSLSISRIKSQSRPIVMNEDGKTVNARESGLVEQVRINQIRQGKNAVARFILREGNYIIYCPSGDHYSDGEYAYLRVTKR